MISKGLIHLIFVHLPQVEKAYRNVLDKYSEERLERQRCEGEYGLYYGQKRAEEQYAEEEEEEEEREIKVQRSRCS